VFHTSSAGNAGQFVPGSFCPSITCGVVVVVVGEGATLVAVAGTDPVVVVVPAVVDVVAPLCPVPSRGPADGTEGCVGLLGARVELVPDDTVGPEARGDAAGALHPAITISAITPTEAGACLIDRTTRCIDCHYEWCYVCGNNRTPTEGFIFLASARTSDAGALWWVTRWRPPAAPTT
jgi:hypothetical protein